MESSVPPRDLLGPQHRRGRIVLVAVAAAVCLVALASPGGAAAGEVHFDPGSPAGKEYALPLTQARDEGGSNKGQKQGNAATPEEVSLFGAGVPSGNGGDGRGGQEGTGNAAGAGGNKAGSDGGGSASPSGSAGQPPKPAARVAEAAVASYSFGSGALLVALVLLAGVGIGLVLRVATRARSA